MQRQTVARAGMKSALLLMTLLGGAGAYASGDDDEHGPGLIDHMGSMQYFSHKLGLSVAAGNKELASFYAHEIEETIEAVSHIKEFDGYPVGTMVEQILTPSVEQFEAVLEGEGDLRAAYGTILESCNQCHAATKHGYIKISFNENNPFNQSF